MKPKFTVIITTYNRANLLEQSLKSLADQTFLDFEVIIVDNFSTDHTFEIVKKFSDLDIKFYKFKNAGIISASRNFAISKSLGEWIAFLDSDDLWSSNKLEKCFDVTNKKVSLIYHGMTILRNDEVFGKIKTRELSNPIFEDLLIKGNTLAFSSVVVKRSIIEEINGFNCSEHMINTSDYNAWLKIAKLKGEFIYLPENLGSYRIHDNNLSNHKFYFPAMAAVQEFFPMISVKKQNKIKGMLLYTQGMIYFSQKQYANSRDAFKSIVYRNSFVFWVKSRIRLIKVLFYWRLKG